MVELATLIQVMVCNQAGDKPCLNPWLPSYPVHRRICITRPKIHSHSLTHWGRMPHICVSKLTIIGSDNDLSPGRCQVIIWTNAGLLSIDTLRTNFSEILSEIYTFSLKKMHLKMSSAKWRPLCLGLSVSTQYHTRILLRRRHGSILFALAIQKLYICNSDHRRVWRCQYPNKI